MGQAFQNQQEQNQELTALLKEHDKEAEELANLVWNKDAVVQNLERRLLNAKKVIAELRAEVRHRDQPVPQPCYQGLSSLPSLLLTLAGHVSAKIWEAYVICVRGGVAM